MGGYPKYPAAAAARCQATGNKVFIPTPLFPPLYSLWPSRGAGNWGRTHRGLWAGLPMPFHIPVLPLAPLSASSRVNWGAGTHGGSQEESGPDSGNVLSFPIHEKCRGGSRAHPPVRGLCVKLHLRLHTVEEEVGQFLRAGGHGALQQLLHPLQALLLQLLQRLQELLAPLLVGSDNSGSLSRSRVGSESSGSSIPSQGGVCGVCDTWSCSMSSSAA